MDAFCANRAVARIFLRRVALVHVDFGANVVGGKGGELRECLEKEVNRERTTSEFTGRMYIYAFRYGI